MSVWNCEDGAAIVAAIAAASSGDYIRLTREYSTKGPYIIPADLRVTNKSLTFGAASYVSSVFLEFGTLYDWLFNYTIAGDFSTLLEGGIFISGRKLGPVWGTPAGTSDSVLEFEVNNDNATLALDISGLNIDAHNTAERCMRMFVASTGGVLNGLVRSCSFHNSVDDNFGVSQGSASTSNRMNVTARGCTFDYAVMGRPMGNHFWANITVEDCQTSGHRFGAFGPSSHGTATVRRCNISIPADLCSGSIDGPAINGNPMPFVPSGLGVDNGATLIVEDSNIVSLGGTGHRKRGIISVPAQAGTSATFRRCTIEQQKNTGQAFLVYALGTLTLEDCTYRHTGDPRFQCESSESGGSFVMGDVATIQNAGTTIIKRSVISLRDTVDLGGTSIYAIADMSGVCQFTGSVFVRHPFSTSQNGMTMRTGIDQAQSFVRGCTIVGRKVGASDASATSDGVLAVAASSQIPVEYCIIIGFNNGMNLATSYAGNGYNVFKNAVFKNVNGFNTKATDKPANNASNTNASLTFVGNTYLTLDARLSGSQDATLLNTNLSIEQIESFALATESPGGSIARSPVYGGPFATPQDSGAYTNPITGVSLSLTATPDADATFLGWGKGGSGTTNPLTVLMTAAKTVSAKFMKNAQKVYQHRPLAGRRGT